MTGAVYQLALAGPTVFAGGEFQAVNNDPSWDNVAAFNASDGAATAFSPVVGGPVFALGATGRLIDAIHRLVGPDDKADAARHVASENAYLDARLCGMSLNAR